MKIAMKKLVIFKNLMSKIIRNSFFNFNTGLKSVCTCFTFMVESSFANFSIMDVLRQKIKNKSANIVIIGLGYVGLPVACLFAKSGFRVLGIDLGSKKVELINKGISPLDTIEEGIGNLVEKAVKKHGLVASVDYDSVKKADVIIIAVDTPVDERNHTPTYKALKSALTSVGKNLKNPSLVIIESTIAPGTVDNLVVPTLEKISGMVVNKDFYVGHCPERLKANKLLHQIQHYPRVVGGLTKETSETMVFLYKNIVSADLDTTDPLTAEIVKTEENSFSDTLIAQANALALLSHIYGVDVNEVINLIKKIPGHWSAYLNPGPGVGGHCIPKDPYLKIYQLKKLKNIGKEGRLVQKYVTTIREVNDFMPEHITNLLSRALKEFDISLRDSKITVLGYSYKENTDDSRNSPTESLVHILKKKVTGLKIQDPYIKEMKGDVKEALRGSDALVLMVGHDSYRSLKLKEIKKLLKRPIIIDGRNFFSREEALKLGFKYKGVGNDKI